MYFFKSLNHAKPAVSFNRNLSQRWLLCLEPSLGPIRFRFTNRFNMKVVMKAYEVVALNNNILIVKKNV